MKRETQKINCFLFNSIAGLGELLWLFTTNQVYIEAIFLLIIIGFSLTFSTLAIIGSEEYTKRFYIRIGFGFILNLLAFILLFFS